MAKKKITSTRNLIILALIIAGISAVVIFGGRTNVEIECVGVNSNTECSLVRRQLGETLNVGTEVFKCEGVIGNFNTLNCAEQITEQVNCISVTVTKLTDNKFMWEGSCKN